MTLKVECGPYTMSIIGGPDDDPVKSDPFVELMETLRVMAPRMYPDEPNFQNLPSMHVHGDGITTFEVASVLTGPPMKPVVLEEFRQWLMPEPMTTDQHKIYGDVPVDELLEFIHSHGGDTKPLRWLIVRNQRAFAEETRRVENLDLREGDL